jgi:hypothetical protein
MVLPGTEQYQGRSSARLGPQLPEVIVHLSLPQDSHIDDWPSLELFTSEPSLALPQNPHLFQTHLWTMERSNPA